MTTSYTSNDNYRKGLVNTDHNIEYEFVEPISALVAIPVLLIVTGVVLWALFAIVVPMFA